MNFWIISAGLLAAFTSLVHVFAGQIDPVRPFLKSDLADVPKATLLACWHTVSTVLIISSLAFIYAGWVNMESLKTAVILLSLTYIIFSVVFIGVGWYFFGYRTLIKLPQWVLLLPIGILGYIGTI